MEVEKSTSEISELYIKIDRHILRELNWFKYNVIFVKPT